MPGLNRTGPIGAGPMTGGQRGLCNPANADYGVDYGAAYGRGMAWGRRGRGGRRAGWDAGFGRGRAFGRQPLNAPDVPQTREDELSQLKMQAHSMQNALNEINQRIASLDGQSKKQDDQGVAHD